MKRDGTRPLVRHCAIPQRNPNVLQQARRNQNGLYRSEKFVRIRPIHVHATVPSVHGKFITVVFASAGLRDCLFKRFLELKEWLPRVGVTVIKIHNYGLLIR